MYDADFIFRECGFDWIPQWIDRELLVQRVLRPCHGEIKLYFLDAARSTIFKVSGRTITKQYDAVRFKAPPGRLSAFLGTAFELFRFVARYRGRRRLLRSWCRTRRRRST
jgi:hypothetical protein